MASARQGVSISGTSARQSRTPPPSTTMRREDRPAGGADLLLRGPKLVAGVQRDLGLRQAGTGAEALRAEPVGRDGA